MVKDKITIADVAKKAGVATATASLALNRNPKVSGHTIKMVSEIAEELGYKNRKERSIRKKQQQDNSPVWRLVFPYYINEYSYTKLDLLIIDTLEVAAHKYNAVVQILRLKENLDLQSASDITKTAHVFIKSNDNIKQIASLNQPACPNRTILFQFEDNTADGLQVSHNYRHAVELIVGKASETNCQEIVLIDSNPMAKQTFLYSESSDLLALVARKKGLNYHYISGPADEITAKIHALRKEKNAKCALVGLRRTHETEQGCLDKIVQSGMKIGSDVECLVCEYDRADMTHHGFHYIDLRGKEIVAKAVTLSQCDGIANHGLFLIDPVIFQCK